MYDDLLPTNILQSNYMSKFTRRNTDSLPNRITYLTRRRDTDMIPDNELLDVLIDDLRNINNPIGLFNDSQNIHLSSIQQSTNKSINNLMKDKLISSKEDLIKELINLNPKCLSQIMKYLKLTNVHSILLITFEDLFIRVFQRIILSEHKTELLIRLNDEMYDSIDKCFTGRLTRLVNVLVGFYEDIEINISDSERISNIILSVLNGEEMTDELKEMCITKLKEAGIEESVIEKWIT